MQHYCSNRELTKAPEENLITDWKSAPLYHALFPMLVAFAFPSNRGCPTLTQPHRNSAVRPLVIYWGKMANAYITNTQKKPYSCFLQPRASQQHVRNQDLPPLFLLCLHFGPLSTQFPPWLLVLLKDGCIKRFLIKKSAVAQIWIHTLAQPPTSCVLSEKSLKSLSVFLCT